MDEQTIKIKRQELMDKLEALGFYRYNEPETVAALKAQAVETGFIWDYARGRAWDEPDVEDLVEGLADRELESMLPFLKLRGIQINNIETERTDETYTLTLDGTTYEV